MESIMRFDPLLFSHRTCTIQPRASYCPSLSIILVTCLVGWSDLALLCVSKTFTFLWGTHLPLTPKILYLASCVWGKILLFPSPCME